LCPEGINYKIENNTLKLFGQIWKNCGSYKTALIIDNGDTIKIPTFEDGLMATCNCLFCFEINIPNFNRESCVVVFEGQTINVVSNSKTNEKIRITPNPFKEFIVVDMNDTFVNNCRIEILNILGQILHKQTILNNSTKIDMSKYEKGVYFVKLFKNDKIIMTEKIMK